MGLLDLCGRRILTLNLLTTTIVAPPSNASKWQMGFNSAFKGLKRIIYKNIGANLFDMARNRNHCVALVNMETTCFALEAENFYISLSGQ